MKVPLKNNSRNRAKARFPLKFFSSFAAQNRPSAAGNLPGASSSFFKSLRGVGQSPTVLMYLTSTYPATQASTGHTPAQASQSIQVASSITYMSPSEMQLTGHSSLQTPQAMHASVILYANILTSRQGVFSQYIGKFMASQLQYKPFECNCLLGVSHYSYL